MIGPRPRWSIIASAALVLVGCKTPPGPVMVVPPPPSVPQQQIADVREILTFLGRQAGLQFVFSPDVNKRVRLNLSDIHMSEAIQTVLTVAGLTLQPTSVAARRVSPNVVFYQLPANVDSLPAEAIVKRFGVGRGIADLIVQSRKDRP